MVQYDFPINDTLSQVKVILLYTGINYAQSQVKAQLVLTTYSLRFCAFCPLRTNQSALWLWRYLPLCEWHGCDWDRYESILCKQCTVSSYRSFSWWCWMSSLLMHVRCSLTNKISQFDSDWNFWCPLSWPRPLSWVWTGGQSTASWSRVCLLEADFFCQEWQHIRYLQGYRNCPAPVWVPQAKWMGLADFFFKFCNVWTPSSWITLIPLLSSAIPC